MGENFRDPGGKTALSSKDSLIRQNVHARLSLFTLVAVRNVRNLANARRGWVVTNHNTFHAKRTSSKMSWAMPLYIFPCETSDPSPLIVS